MEQAGIAADRSDRILEVAVACLERRARAFGDEHFETLHPARTLLILFDDCHVTDADVLEAAAEVESEHPSLRGPQPSELALRVPLPDRHPETLLEDLIAAEPTIRLIALAERLDHARHLHLRDRAAWPAFHQGIGDVYAPVAARTHDRLARRYDWWWHTFRTRFLAGRNLH